MAYLYSFAFDPYLGQLTVTKNIVMAQNQTKIALSFRDTYCSYENLFCYRRT